MASRECPSCHNLSDDEYCQGCLVETVPIEESGVGQGKVVQEERDGRALQGEETPEETAEGIAGSVESQPSGLRQGQCPQCGMPGLPGRECPQCGAMLPVADCGQMTAQAASTEACLVLPGGRRTMLGDGREYLLGRESCLPEVEDALADYAYVSRRHCSIRLDLVSRTLTIWDEGSTNGTFVGRGRRRVCGRESFPLPATIWLGSRVSLDIRL